MKRLKPNTVRNFILMIEAVLIFIDLVFGGDIKIGMGCYWFLVAVYHLTDYLVGYLSDGKEADGKQHD